MGHGSTVWKGVLRGLGIFAGVVLILVGAAGLVLPVIQGTLLILLGIALLAPKSRFVAWLKSLVVRVKNRLTKALGRPAPSEQSEKPPGNP